MIYLLADQVNYLSLSELLAARYCVTSNRVVEINIIMVEIAAIVGSMKSRKALNICLVMVAFFPPEIKMEMITSSKEVRKDNSAAVNTEKRICGRVIRKKAFDLVAPKLLATLS